MSKFKRGTLAPACVSCQRTSFLFIRGATARAVVLRMRQTNTLCSGVDIQMRTPKSTHEVYLSLTEVTVAEAVVSVRP